MRYAAFEGIDGAGKTTVVRDVAKALEITYGLDVVVVREPGGTTTGEDIRSVLLGGRRVDEWTEALLFAAARSQLASEVIVPALEARKVVLSDRSVYSSLAYQGLARGLGLDAVRAVNEAGLGGVWPAPVVLLRLDPEAGVAREDAQDRISVEGLALQKRVAAAYDELAELEADRFIVLDGSEPVEEVVRSATREVMARW